MFISKIMVMVNYNLGCFKGVLLCFFPFSTLVCSVAGAFPEHQPKQQYEQQFGSHFTRLLQITERELNPVLYFQHALIHNCII